MTFNLLTTAWLPVRRRSGRIDIVVPAAIAAAELDAVVTVEWPRPDFRVATLEFLIGLLATACPPQDITMWARLYHEPPDAAALDAAFAPFVESFTLEGAGARFMQDFEDVDAVSSGIGSLLIEAPGERTLDRNRDLMVRRGGVSVLSRAAAAMALFTLQAFAPAGGAGNRTGLRGGGPLITLAIPPSPHGAAEPLLWNVLWANVPKGHAAEPGDPRVFPWLAPTRLSGKEGRTTTPDDAHRLQAFWGMPRRIRLDLLPNTRASACDLTGTIDDVVATGWRQRPSGTNYKGWGGVHPLSPCYRTKVEAELRYVHPQPDGIGYRHFVGILYGVADGARQAAPAIDTFHTERFPEISIINRQWRILAAGFDMENMKARGFIESEMPVFEPADPRAAIVQDEVVASLVAAATIVVGLTAQSVRHALFDDSAAVAADSVGLATLRHRFWNETADVFFAHAARAADGETPESVRSSWHLYLGHQANLLLAEAAPMDASGAAHPERIAAAARQLNSALRGFGRDGRGLFGTLGLDAPEPTVKPTRSEART